MYQEREVASDPKNERRKPIRADSSLSFSRHEQLSVVLRIVSHRLPSSLLLPFIGDRIDIPWNLLSLPLLLLLLDSCFNPNPVLAVNQADLGLPLFLLDPACVPSSPT